jgi:hypothetical protein
MRRSTARGGAPVLCDKSIGFDARRMLSTIERHTSSSSCSIVGSFLVAALPDGAGKWGSRHWAGAPPAGQEESQALLLEETVAIAPSGAARQVVKT